MSIDEDKQVGTPAVQVARNALTGAPMDPSSKDIDSLVRSTAAVTTQARNALVQEEIARRVHWREDNAQTRMTGQPPAPAHMREELQRCADEVKNCEHPYVHIPANVNFKPAGVEDLTRTPVKGAGPFSGTYYLAKDIEAAEIRKAARDTTDLQGAFDALVADWKSGENQVKQAGHEQEAIDQAKGHSE